MASMRTIAAAWLIGLFGAAALAGPLHYPESPRRPMQDIYHGTVVSEDYRWLEATDSNEVVAWVAAQNNLTRSVLDAVPQRRAIKQELQRMLGEGRASRYAFEPAGGWLFALKHQPPKNQDTLVVMSGASPSSERMVLDPNRLDRSGKTTIDWFKPSLDGSLVAVSLSKNGSEDGTLHVVCASEMAAPLVSPLTTTAVPRS